MGERLELHEIAVQAFERVGGVDVVERADLRFVAHVPDRVHQADDPARARTVRRGDLPTRDRRTDRLGRRAEAAFAQLPTRFTAWLELAC